MEVAEDTAEDMEDTMEGLEGTEVLVAITEVANEALGAMRAWRIEPPHDRQDAGVGVTCYITLPVVCTERC